LSVLVPKRVGGELGEAGDRGIQTAGGVLLGEAWIECPGPGGTKHIMDAQANARLWSAAPDMLEALQFILPRILGELHPGHPEYKIVVAAIAKATP
jgi:hypothetical protein